MNRHRPVHRSATPAFYGPAIPPKLLSAALLSVLIASTGITADEPVGHAFVGATFTKNKVVSVAADGKN